MLVEVNAGATDTFRYGVFVLPQGERAVNGPVLSVVGATRNQQAYGANLRWQGPTQLRVEYLQARGQFHLDRVAIHRDGARLALHAAGLADPAAPPGGMAYNLRTPAAAGTPR